MCINKTKGQDWIGVIFRPSGDTTLKNRHDSLLYITALTQDFQKLLFVNTVCCAIHKCKLNLYHTKKKPYVKIISGPKQNGNSFWNPSMLWLWTKEERHHPAGYQQTVQKPSSLMVWGYICVYGVSSLVVWKGNHWWRVHRGFRGTYAPIQTFLSGKTLHISARQS